MTTAGFEDIPYLQRMNRKHHFSLKWTKPQPLVERRNCLGVAERLDFHGRVLTPLSDESLRNADTRDARLMWALALALLALELWIRRPRSGAQSASPATTDHAA